MHCGVRERQGGRGGRGPTGGRDACIRSRGQDSHRTFQEWWKRRNGRKGTVKVGESMVEFTHIQNERAQMVDISGKGDVVREATATGKIFLGPETLTAIREGTTVKGNVLATARVAATLSVKNTPNLIPMCHQIPISSIAVDFAEGEGFIEAIV